MVDFTDYRDLYAKYETLTKISFDYAVVEKEASSQVVRYNGEWKDVGHMEHDGGGYGRQYQGEGHHGCCL